MTANQLGALVGLDSPFGLVPIPGTPQSPDYLRHWNWLFPFTAPGVALTGQQVTVFQGSPKTGQTVAISTTSGLTAAQGTLTPNGFVALTTTLETVLSPTSLVPGKSFPLTTGSDLIVAQGTFALGLNLIGRQLTVGTTTPTLTSTIAIASSQTIGTAQGTPTVSILVPLTTPELTASQGTLSVPKTLALTSASINVQQGSLTASGAGGTTLATRLLTVDQGTLTTSRTVQLVSPGLTIGTTSPGTEAGAIVSLTSPALQVDTSVLGTEIDRPITTANELDVIPGNLTAGPSATLTGDELKVETTSPAPAYSRALVGRDLTVIPGPFTVSVPGEVSLGGLGMELFVFTTTIGTQANLPLSTRLLTVTQGSFSYSVALTGAALTVEQGVVGGAGLTVTPTIIPSCNHGNLNLTVTGFGTNWSGATAWSVTGLADVVLISATVHTPTSATLVVTTGVLTGTLTVTAIG